MGQSNRHFECNKGRQGGSGDKDIFVDLVDVKHQCEWNTCADPFDCVSPSYLFKVHKYKKYINLFERSDIPLLFAKNTREEETSLVVIAASFVTH